MLVNGRPFRTIWLNDQDELQIIDQTVLPHEFRILSLHTVEEVCFAIQQMQVRGAGLIGATAGYGVYIAVQNAPENNFQNWMEESCQALNRTRPTASNLAWALARQRKNWLGRTRSEALLLTRQEALDIADEDAEFCRRIGQHGMEVIREISLRKKGDTVNILTHCNAGWLAFVDYGSALAPIYAAQAEGLHVHVWVDETRPRNQGASLTAWELGQQGISHSLIADNSGGHIMQHGMVDMVITGADRVTAAGDAANKIGTYLKALAAQDNEVPFYVALPSSTFDFHLLDGKMIPIEERNAAEVEYMSGLGEDGKIHQVRICPSFTAARNWSFDVTPAHLISGLITERGICPASREGIQAMFGDRMEN